MTKDKIKIYIMAHKKFTPPEEKGYIPLQVGAALHEDLGYLRDDVGENISDRNQNYSELTGLYWIWKNEKEADITGLVHYRRYFLNARGEILSEEEISETLGKCKAIVSPLAEFEEGVTVRSFYASKHHEKDLEILSGVIHELCPEYDKAFEEVMNGRVQNYANMIICRRELLDAYASWLFKVLFEVEKRCHISDYDSYNQRIFGFMSERLLTVYLRKNEIETTSFIADIREEKADITEAVEEAFRLLDEEGREAFERYLVELERCHADYFFPDADVLFRLRGLKTMLPLLSLEEGKVFEELRKQKLHAKEILKSFLRIARAMQDGQEEAKLCELIYEEDLPASFLLAMISSFEEDKLRRMRIYSGLAEKYATSGQMDRVMIYAQVAMQEGRKLGTQ